MKSLRLLIRIPATLAVAVACTATALTQVDVSRNSIGGPLTGPPVLGVPFPADATTVVHATLGDGTRIDQRTTDRYYRDSSGRVRVERIAGHAPPSTVPERWLRTIVDPAPGDAVIYTMDAETRSYVLSPRSIMATTVGGGHSLHVYIGGVQFVGFRRAGDLLSRDPGAFGDVREEPLGIRLIDGVETVGRRITLVVAPGYRGNPERIEVTDERWESVELNLLLESKHADARSTIEYRLSNIIREEPAAHLFEIPPDYRMGFPLSRDDRIASFVLAENFRKDRSAVRGLPISRRPQPPHSPARGRPKNST